MIYVRLFGGAGNQLFQIAYCIKLQEIYGQDICFDVSKGTEYATKEQDMLQKSIIYDLSIDYNRVHLFTSKKEFDKAAGIKIYLADFFSRLPRALRKATKNNWIYKKTTSLLQLNNKWGLYTAYDCYCIPKYCINNNIYVNGLFSNRLYFDDIYPLLCEIFNFPNQRNTNKEIKKQIIGCNAICMHVRKGSSYTNNPYLNVCDANYYEKAMKIINELIKEPFFFVFSNDFEWCKNNINFSKYNHVLVRVNDEQHPLEELSLMKECKAYILSNSTLGWWGQYLNKSENKIIVSPDKWSKGRIHLLEGLIENNWIKIQV